MDRWSLDRNDRCLTTFYDIRHKGHITVPGDLIITNTITDGIALVSELNGNIVSANGTDVQSYTTDTWTSRRTLDAAPTDVMNGNLDGTEYLIFAIGTGYEYSSAVATWAQSTKDAVNIAFWNERFWGIDATGQLWYTFTMGSAEVNDARLYLSHNEVITGLFRARTPDQEFILYVTTSRGLYAHDIGNRKFVQIEGIVLPDNNAATHERPAVTWRERIYLAAGRGIIEYDPVAATIRDVGFDQDDGMPITEDGVISCLAASTNELFAGTHRASSSDDSVIMAWDGRGWRVVFRQVPALIDSMHVSEKDVSSVTGPHLWWGGTPVISQAVVRILLNVSSTLATNINSFVFRNFSGIGVLNQHIYPHFDAGQSDVIKVALRLKVEVEGASSTKAVVFFTDFDDSGTLTQLDDTNTDDSTFDAADDRIEGNGVTTFLFPNKTNPTGTVFRSFQPAFSLINPLSTNETPDVLSVSLEYFKVLDEKLGFTFELDFNNEHDGQSPEQLRASFAAARALPILLELTYRDDTGNSRNYYVKILPPTQGDEESGHEEGGTMIVRCEEI